MRRNRKAKIIATLGPSSSDEATIRALYRAGADVFRLNFSHDTHESHQQRLFTIRQLEKEVERPIGILMDLQGPKLRVGKMKGGEAKLEIGEEFRLDLNEEPGDKHRAPLLHPEIFAAIKPGSILLLDDGKLRLEVQDCGPRFCRNGRRSGRPSA